MIWVTPVELMQEGPIGVDVKCWETNIHRSHEERLPHLLGQHAAGKEKIEITLTLREKLTEPTSCERTHSSNVMTVFAKARQEALIKVYGLCQNQILLFKAFRLFLIWTFPKTNISLIRVDSEN